jgi:hypothetical protein
VREAAGAGLGLFASQDIKQGDAILSVPVDRGFSALSVNGVLVSTWLQWMAVYLYVSMQRLVCASTNAAMHHRCQSEQLC